MDSNKMSVDIDYARQFIEDHLDKRQVNKIQHSFPSPRFWSERDVPVKDVNQSRQGLLEMGLGSVVNLYVGVPYCIKTNPGKCGYCLFPVEDFAGNGALEDYFHNYLKPEAGMYKDALEGQSLGAVYFGGGTSNLYKAPIYHELMGIVRDLFPNIEQQVDITMEGIPQLFTREKIKAIAESGMNRISIGVQQVNERLNALSGRKQTKKHVMQSLEWAREFGLSSNVDLIFGWPQQTESSMVKDLEQVISWGVYDITHYELNVGGPTDFALNRYHELPSTLANLEMYKVSRDLLISHGYEQITAYNWRKPGDPFGRKYEEGVTRRADSMNTVGLGYAAITFFGDVALENRDSWSYINWRDLEQYKVAIKEGRYPVECGFRHESEDFLLFMIFRNLFGMELDRKAYQSAFGVDVYHLFKPVWSVLDEFGFLEITDDKLRLLGDGPFYTPLIQTLVAEQRYKELRKQMVGSSRKSVTESVVS